MSIILINDACIEIRYQNTTAIDVGISWLQAQRITFGTQAAKQSRREYHYVFNDFWMQLNNNPVVAINSQVSKQSDFIFHQLSKWKQHYHLDDIIFATPSHYNNEQIKLLTAIAQQASLTVLACIPLSLFETAMYSHQLTGDHKQVVIGYLDIQLHQCVYQTLSFNTNDNDDANNGSYQITSTRYFENCGLYSLQSKWLQWLKQELLDNYRYDITHNADIEQQAFDAFHSIDWDTDNIELKFDHSSAPFNGHINPTLFRQRLIDYFQPLTQLQTPEHQVAEQTQNKPILLCSPHTPDIVCSIIQSHNPQSQLVQAHSSQALSSNNQPSNPTLAQSLDHFKQQLKSQQAPQLVTSWAI